MVTGDPNGGQSPGIGLEIGLREIYDELRRLATGYERVDAKLESAMGNQSVRLEALGRDIADNRGTLTEHEKRIRDLETRPVITPRAVWTAVTALITSMGVIVALLSLILSHQGK